LIELLSRHFNLPNKVVECRSRAWPVGGWSRSRGPGDSRSTNQRPSWGCRRPVH